MSGAVELVAAAVVRRSVVTPWGTAFVTSFENFLLEFFRRLLLCRVPVSLLCGGVCCRAAFVVVPCGVYTPWGNTFVTKSEKFF